MDKRAILDYGEEFRRQLLPLVASEIHHGGFIMPCLVHCVTGYAYWAQGAIEGVVPSAAFLSWLTSLPDPSPPTRRLILHLQVSWKWQQVDS
jgi:hypothetical protein